MYVIVVGAGDIGTPLVARATAAGHEVVVLEKDPDVAERTAHEFDCMVLNVDATSADALEEGGAHRADAIISTAESDATNVMVMLLADELGIDSRVSVVHGEEHMSLFRRIGVNTIEHPEDLIAEHLFRAVQRPSVKDALHLAGDAEVFEITVTNDSPLAGKSLETADEEGLLWDEDVLVVALQRNGEVITPHGGTTLEAGDLVTVFSKHGFSEEVTKRFAPEPYAP